MKPWFERNPGLYSRIARAVEHEFPTLHLLRENDTLYLRGRLNITVPEFKAPIAAYDIELEFPVNYPDADPIVRETGGVIPKDADHHFYETGFACLFLPEARWQYCRPHPTISEFINGPVKAFFAWQAHLMLTGKKPPSGEWRHGIAAILDFYFEQLQTKDVRVVRTFLEQMTAKKIKSHWRCYCGTGQLLRQCHFARVQFLKDRIPRRRAVEVLEAIHKTL
jgi:hypothetical protein